MALLLVITAAHYIIVEQESHSVRLYMQNESTATGVKILYNMTSKAYVKLPIVPVKPQYIFSTDDTVVYVLEGV